MTNKLYDFYEWQIKAFNIIKGESAVLSAPTGSGKTLVAYLWADIINEDGFVQDTDDRIIFTAPIKALSNERYMDLRRMGLDVGIETGDFKRNENARIICCTQEIYTMKYTAGKKQKLIVDEFHYIFNDPDRTRTYIDGLRASNPNTPILVMSATFGGAKVVRNYLSEVCRRDFKLYESHKRMTKLVFLPKKPALMSSMCDALVFVFSQKAAVDCAMKIASARRPVAPESSNRLRKLAEILEVPKISPPLLKGVGIYHGGMFPKEKLLVESAFRERIIDVVCGTSALSLGVNLPAQTVVFAQLVQYHHDEPIGKNEFLQMAGRAGRKGLFDVGYATWLENSPYERRGINTGEVFAMLCEMQAEQARVTLRPSYGRLLRKQVLMDTEAEYMAEYSFPHGDPRFCIEILRSGLEKIDRSVRKLVHGKGREKYRKILAAIWYDEMEIDENLEMATMFFDEQSPSALMAAQMILPFERNYLQALLKVKRFANNLPKGYSFRSMSELNSTVGKIDPTIYGCEEKIGEIENS